MCKLFILSVFIKERHFTNSVWNLTHEMFLCSKFLDHTQCFISHYRLTLIFSYFSKNSLRGAVIRFVSSVSLVTGYQKCCQINRFIFCSDLFTGPCSLSVGQNKHKQTKCKTAVQWEFHLWCVPKKMNQQ